MRHYVAVLMAAILIVAGYAVRTADSQTAVRVAQIPGINPGPCSPGPEEKPWLNSNQTPGCRALEAIASMTLEEKIAELGGITGRSANKRLELVSGGGSDGPNGIASMGSGPPQERGRNVTAFANAVTLAATWDRELASQYGKALGEEFAGKGSNSVLGPTINIMRTWHWGRNGETFSEDPYITAEIAVAEIKALNAQKVLTVLKHYAGNNQENTRCGVIPDNAGVDARMTEKALHEIYLPGFKASVERAGTGGIMCSYNQVNGKFACNNTELLGYLREWGFDGFIAPDAAFALRDALTGALAGVTRVGGREVAAFIKDEKIKESDLDRMLYYNLTPYFRLGIYDSPSNGKPGADVSTPEHQALARKVAEEGAVVGYRWYDAKNQEPLFPFGHGLSYTEFQYADLQISRTGGDQATVKARITNTGTREGAEVVQLYIGCPAAAAEPPKQLKGFEKIRLRPGRSKVVTMTLDKNSLAVWDVEGHGWKAYSGVYSVMLGSSSRDIRLQGSFPIK